MREENIVKYTRDNLPEDTETDLERVKAMTEEEIERAARSDPDAQPADDAFLARATVVVSVPMDQETFKWYQGQGDDVEAAVSAALREYKEAHLSS